MNVYVLAGIGFFVLTILLSWYITGYGLDAATHFAIGFRAMAIFYLLGSVLLFFLAIRFF